METLKIFHQTKMFELLTKVAVFLHRDFGLDNFKNSSPFWNGDEQSYFCFLSVLENECNDTLFSTIRITRKTSQHILYIVKEVMDLLLKFIPDDTIESPVSKRCCICLFNKANIKLKCNHTVLCQKCYNIMIVRGVTTCPLCRSEI